MRIAFAVCVALLAALAAVACGEDEQETFRKEFRPLNQRIVALDEDLGRSVQGASGKSDTQIETEFGRLAQRTDGLQREADALQPPDELKRDQEGLVAAMGDAEAALREIEKAAAESDANAARQATIQLAAASGEVRASRRKLARATGA